MASSLTKAVAVLEEDNGDDHSIDSKPYRMCSCQECEERERTGEVSIWEQLMPDVESKDTSESSSKHYQHRSQPNSTFSSSHRGGGGRGRGGRGRGRGPRGRGGGRGGRGHRDRNSAQNSNHHSNNNNHTRNNNNNNSRRNNARPLRRIDPCRAVQKYRRSAAGSAEDGKIPYRSVKDLAYTVEYLLLLLAGTDFAETPPSSRESLSKQQQQRLKTFRSLIEFWENRMRAVQVDWIKLRATNDLTLHAGIIRSQILILYLLSDSPEYELTFGQRALSSYLAQFWKDYFSSLSQWNVDKENEDIQGGAVMDSDTCALVDEMLLYSTIFQLQQDICRKATSGNNNNEDIVVGQSVLETYRSLQDQHKEQFATRTSTVDFPLFQHALQLFNDCCLGHWCNLLQSLATMPSNTSTKFAPHIAVLVKCIMAPALAKIRWKALQAYNVSWNKGEKVSSTDVAKLLQYQKPAEALQFAQQVGLPTDQVTKEQSDGTNEAVDVVLFKTEPIQPFSLEGVQRRHDDFVFCQEKGQNPVSDISWRQDGESLRIPSKATMQHLIGLDIS